jgi:hypothetical protein
LTIPGFAACFDETVQPEGHEEMNLSSENSIDDAFSNNSPNQIAQDAEVWQAYLAIEQKWEEVFRRLANS